MKRTAIKRKTPLRRTKGVNKISPGQALIDLLWKKLANYLMAHRAHGLCEIRATEECKARGFKPGWLGLHGHHIIKRRFNIHKAENCLIGCQDCHNHTKYGTGTPLSVDYQLVLAMRLNKKHNIDGALDGSKL